MNPLSTVIGLPARAVRSVTFRTKRIVKRAISRRRIRLASRQILQRYEAHRVKTNEANDTSQPDIATLLSYKVTDADRFYILKTVVGNLKRALNASKIPLYIIDASDDEYLAQTRSLYDSGEMPVVFENSPRRLTEAYLQMMQSVEQKYFYLQFDDFISVGLKPEFLGSCCRLLEKYEGLVDVVAIMWPQGVQISQEKKTVEVLAYETAPSTDKSTTQYQFGFGGPQVPVCIETIGGYEFAIFENFIYGFFFNHLVAPTKDYRDRLEWYMNNVSRTSVHQIELAAEDRTLGPYWTHVAICLSDIALLDLDYAHTVEAVRPENKSNKEVCDALNQGYALRATHS